MKKNVSNVIIVYVYYDMKISEYLLQKNTKCWFEIRIHDASTYIIACIF